MHCRTHHRQGVHLNTLSGDDSADADSTDTDSEALLIRHTHPTGMFLLQPGSSNALLTPRGRLRWAWYASPAQRLQPCCLWTRARSPRPVMTHQRSHQPRRRDALPAQSEKRLGLGLVSWGCHGDSRLQSRAEATREIRVHASSPRHIACTTY